MQRAIWCEHLEKRSKFTLVDYRCLDGVTKLKVQSWFCPECGVHGAETAIIQQTDSLTETPPEPSLLSR